MSEPYVLLGWHLSYFTGKARAYLRWKGAPLREKPVDALTLMWQVPRRTGASVMPVVVTPQGEWLQDTKHIMEVLEARLPGPPVTPTTPRQRIAALLLEAWFDEAWIPSAMHYRWNRPENYALFEADAGAALLPWAPRFLQRRLAARIAARLRSYLPAVGVVPDQHALLERWTVQLLDVLERHFAVLPFLFGARPCVADFALLGPLYAHFGRDPWPRAHLIAPRPQVAAWIERMNALAPGAGGELLAGDALPPTLQPLFDTVFAEFLPMVARIRDELARALPGLAGRGRVPRMLGTIEFPMADGRFRRGAMPYTLWMMQRVLDAYTALDGAGRAAVDAWTAQHGAPGALRLDAGVRLQRAGLHVKLAGAAA